MSDESEEDVYANLGPEDLPFILKELEKYGDFCEKVRMIKEGKIEPV